MSRPRDPEFAIDGVRRAPPVTFIFDGEPITANAGETVAMALWVHGRRVLRGSSRDGAPRGMLCAMGVCYECLVRIDGAVVRACTTLVREGLVVERGGRP